MTITHSNYVAEMAITHSNDAAEIITALRGTITMAESGRTIITLPEPWVCVQGTWTSPEDPGIAIVHASGVPLMIDLDEAEPGWILAAVANGVRQSVADAAAGVKDPAERTAKITARAETLAPGLAANWGRSERTATAIDPLRAAILAILSGKLSRYGKAAPRLKGSSAEMFGAFRAFGEAKRGSPLPEGEWAAIELKIRREAADILAAQGEEDPFG